MNNDEGPILHTHEEVDAWLDTIDMPRNLPCVVGVILPDEAGGGARFQENTDNDMDNIRMLAGGVLWWVLNKIDRVEGPAAVDAFITRIDELANMMDAPIEPGTKDLAVFQPGEVERIESLEGKR